MVVSSAAWLIWHAVRLLFLSLLYFYTFVIKMHFSSIISSNVRFFFFVPLSYRLIFEQIRTAFLWSLCPFAFCSIHVLFTTIRSSLLPSLPQFHYHLHWHHSNCDMWRQHQNKVLLPRQIWWNQLRWLQTSPLWLREYSIHQRACFISWKPVFVLTR